MDEWFHFGAYIRILHKYSIPYSCSAIKFWSDVLPDQSFYDRTIFRKYDFT